MEPSEDSMMARGNDSVIRGGTGDAGNRALRELSASERKTIEFGLAVAIISSCPQTSPSSLEKASKGFRTLNGPSMSCEDPQRASKQLCLWQGACLQSLIEAGGINPPVTAKAPWREKTESPGRGDSRSGRRIHNRLKLRDTSTTRGRTMTAHGHCASSWGNLMPSMKVNRDTMNDSLPHLRALEAAALAGGQTDAAREIQMRAIGGLWAGHCTPQMMTVFATQMLEQVVLRGQGGSDHPVYTNVLSMLVTIVDPAAADVINADSSASVIAERNNVTHSLMCNVAASSYASQRLKMALAISEAFDAILVRLARSLRDSEATGRRGGLQRPATAVPHTAMAQALGMGLFVDAYEDVVVSLIQAFAFLTSEERKAHSQAQSADQAQRRFVPTEQLLDRRPKIRTGASNGSPPSSSRSGRGLLVVGEDVQKRRQAWVQRKLEVLAEVTTTMSTFRMGQLRVHRIVTRFCWPTDTT